MRCCFLLLCVLLAGQAHAAEGCKIQPLGWSADGRQFAYEAQRSTGSVGVVVNAYTNHVDTYALNPNRNAFAAWQAQAHPHAAQAGLQTRAGKATVRVGNGTGAWKGEAFEFAGEDGIAVQLTPTVVAAEGETAVESWTIPGRKHAPEGAPVEGDLRAFFSPDGARVAWLLCIHGSAVGDSAKAPEDAMRVGSVMALTDETLGPDQCNRRTVQAYPVLQKSLAAAAKLRATLADPNARFTPAVEEAHALRGALEQGAEPLAELLCGGDSQNLLAPCMRPFEIACDSGALVIRWSYFADVPQTPEEALALTASDAVLEGPRDLFHTCCAGARCADKGVGLPNSWVDAQRFAAQITLAAHDTKFGNAMLESWKRSAQGLLHGTCSCDTPSKSDLADYARRLDDAAKGLPAGARAQSLKAQWASVAKSLRQGLPKNRCDVRAGGN